MSTFTTVAIGVLGGLAVMAGIGWVGLQVKPANLPFPTDPPQDLGVVTIPDDVPAPVRRYYQTALGDQISHVESLAVYGRARANFGLWVPLRYRLVHRPGYAFERYMEVTWFGFPLLKAIDRYVGGKGMTGPMGKEAVGPEVDQGANMILWAEAPLMPSLWITDERLRWEAIDDTSARLIFPYDGADEDLTVYFDPETGLITRMTALRYRDAESGKIPWHVDFLAWQSVDGVEVPKHIAITWSDQGKPWSTWDMENVLWNVDISEMLPAHGDQR